MEVRVPGRSSVARLVHPSQASVPMKVRVSGRSSVVRLVHPEKAS